MDLEMLDDVVRDDPIHGGRRNLLQRCRGPGPLRIDAGIDIQADLLPIARSKVGGIGPFRYAVPMQVSAGCNQAMGQGRVGLVDRSPGGSGFIPKQATISDFPLTLEPATTSLRCS